MKSPTQKKVRKVKAWILVKNGLIFRTAGGGYEIWASKRGADITAWAFKCEVSDCTITINT